MFYRKNLKSGRIYYHQRSFVERFKDIIQFQEDSKVDRATIRMYNCP